MNRTVVAFFVVFRVVGPLGSSTRSTAKASGCKFKVVLLEVLLAVVLAVALAVVFTVVLTVALTVGLVVAAAQTATRTAINNRMNRAILSGRYFRANFQRRLIETPSLLQLL